MADWSEEQEKLLAQWSERSSGYRWMHDRSSKKFRKQNYTLAIPSIVISTVAGSANFLVAGKESGENSGHEPASIPLMIGISNIVVAVLGTVSQFLRLAENAENHRNASIAFGSFYRHISCELSMPRDNRASAQELVNSCRKEFDRLIENSPEIPDKVLQEYTAMMKENTHNEVVSKPDIAEGVTPTVINRKFSHLHMAKEKKARRYGQLEEEEGESSTIPENEEVTEFDVEQGVTPVNTPRNNT